MVNETRDPETYSVIGAAMAVHSQLGAGFLESVYREALSCEFRRRQVPYDREVPLPVYYCGERLDVSFRVDFVCFDGLLVEIKSQLRTGWPEFAQVVNYLKASNLHRALLINFGASRLQYRRLVF